MKRANLAKRGAQNYIELVAITWKNIGKILWRMPHMKKKNWLLTLIEGGIRGSCLAVVPFSGKKRPK